MANKPTKNYIVQAQLVEVTWLGKPGYGTPRMKNIYSITNGTIADKEKAILLYREMQEVLLKESH